jgi:hypothetical protein
MIETSTTGSGDYASFLPQKHSFTGTIDGIVVLDEMTMLSLADLRQRQLSMQKLLMRFTRTDRLGNVYTDECNFFVTSSSDNGALDGVAEYSISLQGTGAITQVFTPTTLQLHAVKIYPQIDDTQAFAGGETSITISLLIGKDILDVSIDGISFYTIITTGTPVSKQVKYDTSTGTFSWMIPAEPGQVFKIEYQDI